MSTLQNKIDFALVIRVRNANPNGDPLNGNRPRTDYEGLGEITDVCIKRKLRDRLQESGQAIFVQSDERKTDGEPSLRARAESDLNGLGKKAFGKGAKKEDTAKAACAKWFDVRAFGQVFAFGNNGDAGGVSIPVRGPVTIQSAFSKQPVSITSTQITKSVSGDGDGSKRSSDTMGMKHRVDSGVYECYGSINPQLAERTGFSDTDAEVVKNILPKLFENDSSSARPEGSMEVLKVIWWKHASRAGQHSSAKVHRSLTVNADGSIEFATLEGLSTRDYRRFLGPSMYSEDDLLPLSGLQHLAFCERQWALIHIEQLWSENRLTAEGRLLHSNADDGPTEARRGIRIVRGLALHSFRLGLSGKADVVEFPIDGSAPSPVEYKRGRPKLDDWDKIQLCAQALCLEEMCSARVTRGAIFYWETRRRLEVTLDSELRAETERLAARMHYLYSQRASPLPEFKARCRRCSLLDTMSAAGAFLTGKRPDLPASLAAGSLLQDHEQGAE